MLCVVALFFNNNCPRIHEWKQTHKNKYYVIFYIRLYLKTRLKFYYYYYYYYYYWLKLW